MQLGKNTQNYGHTLGQNKHSDPIFSLQFLNVLYVADICAKFEKNLHSTSFSRELPEKKIYVFNTCSGHKPA